MSNENPVTVESIDRKIKAHGETLEKLDKQITTNQRQLDQAIDMQKQVVGAVKQLQEIKGELQKPTPVDVKPVVPDDEPETPSTE
jgi:response regulator of citrate/malate metabolism